MPIYEYLCEPCDNRFEKLRPISAAGQPSPCPRCGNCAPQAVTRTARITGQGEGEATDQAPMDAMPAAAHGHGHSHGPMGHMH